MSSLRALVPKHLQRRVRSAYVATGTATAALRTPPAFMMVGASRAGTTTLFHALTNHPQVARPPVNKGVRYFDLNYRRGWNWYLGHFPLRATTAARRSWHREQLVFEASGYYLYHPLVPARLAHDLPDVKLIAMLRDPVERAYSGWKHESARGFETASFEQALDAEEERLDAALRELAADQFATPHSLRHHSHRSRGEYITQLDRFLAQFRDEQVHVLISEEFFAHPEREFAKVCDFLQVSVKLPAKGFPQENARPSSPMPASIRARLQDHYQPLNEELSKRLGRDLPW